MTVAIRKLIVPEHHRRVSSGQAVRIIVQVVDSNLTDVLLNPSDGVTITLYSPLDEILLDEVVMVNLQIGHFATDYQTKAGDPAGYYTARITVGNNSLFARLSRTVVFKLIIPEAEVVTPTPVFTYLVIKDQTGKPWYWYVNIAHQLVSDALVPELIFQESLQIPGEIYWFTVLNGNGDLRYIYPDITGTWNTSTTQPLVGNGQTDSPLFIGVNGGLYELDLNILDQLEVLQV